MRSYRFGVWLALALPALGQVSEAGLQARYGKPADGSYRVRPGVTMATLDGPRGEACVLTLSGTATEQELTDILQEAVPNSERGKPLNSVAECVGLCKTIRTYEKAIISLFSSAGPSSDPLATVIFKSKRCAGKVKESTRQPQEHKTSASGPHAP